MAACGSIPGPTRLTSRVLPLSTTILTSGRSLRAARMKLSISPLSEVVSVTRMTVVFFSSGK